MENRLINVSKGSGKVGFPAVSPNTTFDNFPAGTAKTSRTTYTLAGRTIATRVTGDPMTSNNGLFYIFSDHLGSTSVLATSTGSQVPGSKTAYYPFGSPRTTPTQTITDRNFTGQKENLELGLIYYNARYYVPTIGRFASPDTIVPNPINPQQFNRYTYTMNNPTNFIDPSGHCVTGYAEGQYDDQECWTLAFQLHQQFGFNLDNLLQFTYDQLTYTLEGINGLIEQGTSMVKATSIVRRKSILQKYALYWGNNSSINSLEAATRTTEFAFILGAKVDELLAVLSGHVGDGVDNILQGSTGEGILPHPSDMGRFNTFDDFQTDGFNTTYADPDPSNNQVHHTFYYVQLAYYNADLTAYAGNIVHEYLSTDEGQSIQDYRAGLWGIGMGHLLQNNNITLKELANRMRVDLGQ